MCRSIRLCTLGSESGWACVLVGLHVVTHWCHKITFPMFYSLLCSLYWIMPNFSLSVRPAMVSLLQAMCQLMSAEWLFYSLQKLCKERLEQEGNGNRGNIDLQGTRDDEVKGRLSSRRLRGCPHFRFVRDFQKGSALSQLIDDGFENRLSQKEWFDFRWRQQTNFELGFENSTSNSPQMIVSVIACKDSYVIK